MIMIKTPDIFKDINAALELIENEAEQRFSENLSEHNLIGILDDLEDSNAEK